MKKISHIPTFLGIFVLVFGTALGVFVVSQRQSFGLGAAGQNVPRDVKVTNITDSAFTVSWTTDKPVIGKLSWGDNSNVGRLTGDDKLSHIHSATVTGLVASKTYYFKINSGGTLHTNQGNAWITQTRNTIATQTAVFAGTILTPEGTPASESIVYLTGTNIPDLSAQTSSNGTWTISAQIPVNVSLDSAVVEIFVQAGPLGVATAQISASAGRSTPPISLGKTYDFRSLTPNDSNGPTSQLSLPPTTTSNRTGFGETTISASTNSTVVTLKSLKDKERISTKKPEFFGDGPAGTSITITVQSDPITQVIKIPQTGTWRWSVPSTLEEGAHKITITWKDTNGILRSLTRDFTVLAASDEPAFESTPSATTTPRPTATATPRPTATPTVAPTATPAQTATPAATIKPTATAKPTPIASTESALPNAGVELPTIALLLFGFALMGSGVVVYKKGS